MSPGPVKTVKRTVFVVRHWKLVLILALILVPLVSYSYHTCSQQAGGCSTFKVIVGVIKILAAPLT